MPGIDGVKILYKRKPKTILDFVKTRIKKSSANEKFAYAYA